MTESIMDKYTKFIGDQAAKYNSMNPNQHPDLPQTGIIPNTTVLPPNASQSPRKPLK